MHGMRTLLGLSGIALLLSTQNAYAYLDPGTGSIILQGLIGGIAGTLFAVRLYWGKLKSHYGRMRRSTTDKQSPDQEGR